jgi:hypothetical protein
MSSWCTTDDGEETFVARRLRQLGVDVEGLADTAEWKRWLAVAARFPSYTFFNTLGLWAQMETATEVQGYVSWARCGRQVRKGENSLRVIGPRIKRKEDGTEDIVGWMALPVFDISQTEPATLITKRTKGGKIEVLFDAEIHGPPYQPMVWPSIDSDQLANLWPYLVEAADAVDIEVTLTDKTSTARGWCFPAKRVVKVKADLSPADKVAVLLHELGHVEDQELVKAVVEHTHDRKAKPDAERVAESVAWLAAERCGLDTTEVAAFYLATWDADADSLVAAGKRIAGSFKRVSAIVDQALILQGEALDAPEVRVA